MTRLPEIAKVLRDRAEAIQKTGARIQLLRCPACKRPDCKPNSDKICAACLISAADACDSAARLPVTLDKEYATPGMELFYVYELNGRKWVSPAQPGADPRYCYAHRELAEAAASAAGREGQ